MSPDPPRSRSPVSKSEEHLGATSSDQQSRSLNHTKSHIETGSETILDLLWDGGQAAVLLKPAGIPTQAPKNFDSLERRARNQFASRSQYFACPHRLDRPVQGVILVAFQKRTARLLSSQFETRKVEKEYLAWTAGKVPSEPTLWVDYLEKVPNQARVIITDEAKLGAKLAKTEVQALHYSEQLDCTLLRLKPVTGRMHQLRAQAAHRGYPILGDTTYEQNPEFGGTTRESDSIQNHRVGETQTTARLSLMKSLGMPALTPPLSSSRDATMVDAIEAPDWIALRAQILRFFDPRSAKRIEVSADQRWIESPQMVS